MYVCMYTEMRIVSKAPAAHNEALADTDPHCPHEDASIAPPTSAHAHRSQVCIYMYVCRYVSIHACMHVQCMHAYVGKRV